MSIRHLDRLLEPKSVAIVGASDRAGSVGATVWRNVRAAHFAGPVQAVNPRRTELDGVAVFARVADLPQPPDLAVLCTPPDTVAGLIEELGRLGTRAAIVMTAGLSAAQKQAMLAAARPHLLRVLGSNCLGLLSPHIGLNASFAHTDALAGKLAFVSQSGALVTAVLDWAKTRQIGFSHMVSLGERADVDFGDLLDYLASDARTRSILLYIESIEQPRKFMSAARAAARNKPVIVVKAGRAGNGLQAAASHTGALAGSDIVFDAAIRRAGMLRVDTLADLFMAAQTLARFANNRDQTLTLMTNGGGAGVMAADAAALANVPLHELSARLRETLNAVLPATWSGGNPIDIIGDAPVQRYTDTLAALLADADNGAVLFMHAPTAIVRSGDIARACAPLLRQTPGRVMACWLGGETLADARRVFETAGAADYDTPEEAVRAFAMLATYRRNQTLLLEAPTASENGPPDIAAARVPIEAALAAGRDMLNELEAKAVLGAYGIPVVPTVVSIDPLFGPVLLFGQGGTAVEVLADRAIALPPLNRVLARDLVSRTRVAKLLAGYRDHPPARLDAVCDVLIGLSQMLADLPELAELDINPLWADHEGVLALDARLRVSRQPGAGAANFAITPYPAELVETVAWQGQSLVLRPIRPEDEAQHKAFVDHLRPEDLRLRFFSVRRELPRSELARLTQIDYAREMAFIAVRSLPDASAQTLGVVRAVIDPDNVDAEFAIIVRSDLKGHGLGHLLMRKMIQFLERRGTLRMIGQVLPENSAMQDLVRSNGFVVDPGGSDADALQFVLALNPGGAR